MYRGYPAVHMTEADYQVVPYLLATLAVCLFLMLIQYLITKK